MSKSKLFTFLLIFLSFSAIFCFYNFEPVSAYTGTITYNAGTNTITCVGGSSSTPITFNDLYLADVAGSWDKISKQGVNQFFLSCKLVIGDGSTMTYFNDINKQITFASGILTSPGYLINIYKSNFTLGEVSNSTVKSVKNGCSINFADGGDGYFLIRSTWHEASVFHLYGCSFQSIGGSSIRCRIYANSNDSNIWGCTFSNAYLYNYNGDLFQNSFYNTLTALENVNGFLTNLAIYSVNTAIWHNGETNITIKNVFTRDCKYLFNQYFEATGNLYLINFDTDNWLGSFRNAYSTGKVYRQYTFDLNVLNGEITDFVENATVQLWKDSVLVYEGITNSSGMIPTQTLTYGYYQQSTGSTIQNATSPYYLVISHPDWQTYISRFYITEPLRLTVSMQEPTYTGYTEVEKSDYTTIILFVISLILCIIGLALTVPLLPLIALTVSVINVLLLTEISMFNILLIILNIIFTVITIVRTKTKNN